MDPYGFQYRSKAHLVAVADIILSSISFGWSLIFLLAAFAISEAVKSKEFKEAIDEKGLDDDEKEKVQEFSTTFIVWFWLMAVTLFAICIIGIVAAVKLLNATNPGVEPTKAYKWSKFWRGVNIFFLVLLVLNLLFCSTGRGFFGYIFVLFCIGVRSTALYLVQKFFKEVEGFTQCGQTLPGPGAMYQSQYPNDGGGGGDMMKQGQYDYNDER